MMPRNSYEGIAGHALHRLAGLSDGVFAIAMTLLVLEIHVPSVESVHTEAALWNAFLLLSPKLLMYVMSFLTLGIFWLGQQTQLDHLAESDRNLVWIHIGFLASICMLPFSTGVMGEFLHLRIALLLYWLNILLAGIALYASWRYAVRTRLIKSEVSEEMIRAISRRILAYQAIYAASAALCVFGTLWSVGLLLLAQLNSALAPRFGILRRF
jgi:uncharacterized membrane protein